MIVHPKHLAIVIVMDLVAYTHVCVRVWVRVFIILNPLNSIENPPN